jgi:transcription-repair coupling factor (superfamily II helicase)
MIGVEDVSVIATPPARRRPIRTFLAPFDAATVRTALLREKRRGGQSFVVVPRIEDITPIEKILSEAAPELSVRVAHGKLPPEAVDEVMVGFADGQGDVLLATNIIESGLDVPNANTMLVWRADRFGLAQLHQLRGRVGRGRRQGTAYLWMAPDSEVAEATRKRLSTLEAFDRLGSGLAISAQDLDLRGAGDLLGEDQAGHVREIGTSLYQHLLTRAVRVARGEIAGADWTPEINIGAVGSLSSDYVPDPIIRLNLLARLARMESIAEIDEFGEELEDRFGVIPKDTLVLLDIARLSARARDAGVIRIDSGPKALALSFQNGREPSNLSALPDASIKEGRLICAREGDADDAKLLSVVLKTSDQSSPASPLSN